MVSNKEIISYRKTIAAGTAETLRARVKGDGTVEEVRARFYPGQENSLHVRPYLNKKPDIIVDLISYAEGANRYLSGDDDYYVYPVALPCRIDDEVHVYVYNTAPYDYTLVVDVVIDYLGGQNRVV